MEWSKSDWWANHLTILSIIRQTNCQCRFLQSSYSFWILQSCQEKIRFSILQSKNIEGTSNLFCIKLRTKTFWHFNSFSLVSAWGSYYHSCCPIAYLQNDFFSSLVISFKILSERNTLKDISLRTPNKSYDSHVKCLFTN